MRPIFTQSHETSALVEFFRTMKFDAPVSYAAASKIVNFTVRSTLPAYHSAKRIAERDHAVVIESIRGYGFVRLVADKIVDQGIRGIRHIRRTAERSALKQEIAIGMNLDQSHMIRATELLSRFRIISDTARIARSNRATVDTPEQGVPVDIPERLKSVR